MNGFQLVDTPGLDANETDTAEAQSVFQKASLILFVHSQQNGELIREEADFLEQLCTHFTDPEIRHQTIIPVLTKCEGVPSEELDKIEQSLRKQWQQILGREPIQVFRTRTNSYFKGITENKPPLTQISEIPTLIDYIAQRVSDVSIYQQKLAEQRINDSVKVIQKHIRDVMKAKNARRLEIHQNVLRETKHLEKDTKLFTKNLEQEYKSLSQ